VSTGSLWIGSILTGSRNLILENPVGFRADAANQFIGKLYKGETVFYEIVGYENFDTPIMSTVTVNDKELKAKYGDKVTYHYGCKNGQHDVYVYRMTLTNEDGHTVDYPWHLVKKRCMEMNVKVVPEMGESFVFATPNCNSPEAVERELALMKEDIEKMVDGPDPVGLTHPREGICVRLNDRAFKHKSFTFGVLEGYIKDKDDYVDTEESA
jgi:hypothetical protein